MGDDSVRLRERHESLYFTDGNVVLLAPRPDKPGLLFRVHKSVLSSHSPIFKDMFDVCSPSDSTSETKAGDFYDGVPLIYLPDNANHLESVLKILYYQSTLPWIPRSLNYPALISIITPILDLSRKYGIDRMREQVQAHLESDWPQTLKEWDKLEREIEFMGNDSGAHDNYFPEPAATIKLARQFDIPSILPAAFYHLSRLSILDDWDKTHADPSTHIRNPAKRTAQWGLLSAKDFRCLLLGKAELAKFMRGCINVGDLCHLKDAAKWDRECEAGEGLWDDLCDRCLQSADPLALLRSSVESEVAAVGCFICAKRLRVEIASARAKFWDKLGDMFYLEDE